MKKCNKSVSLQYSAHISDLTIENEQMEKEQIFLSMNNIQTFFHTLVFDKLLCLPSEFCMWIWSIHEPKRHLIS